MYVLCVCVSVTVSECELEGEGGGAAGWALLCFARVDCLAVPSPPAVSKLSRVQSELRDLTAQLASERTLRQNKEEYEALAKKINEVPDRWGLPTPLPRRR